MKKLNIYMKKYWKEHPDKYNIHKEKMILYMSTRKNKNKNTAIKFKEKHPDYFVKYMIKRRKIARILGICTRCNKHKSVKGRVSCIKCIKINREFLRKRRKQQLLKQQNIQK